MRGAWAHRVRRVRLDLVAVSSCQPLPEPLEVSVMLSLLGGAVDAAYHVVSAFAQVLAPLAGGLASAAAIVAFTMAVRLLLFPLSYYATRGLASQAALAPQIQALQKRHAGQPARVQPYATLVVAALMPLATGLYLLTTTAWSAAERAIVARRTRPSAAPEPGEPGAAARTLPQ